MISEVAALFRDVQDIAATVVHILLDTESCSDLSLISIYTVVGSFASLVNAIVRVFSIGFKIHFTPFRTIKNIRRQPTIITTKFSGFISFWYNSVFFFELSVGDTHDLVNTEWYDILQYTINYTFWIFTILFYGYSSCTCIFYKPAVVSISVIFPWHPLTWSQSEILQIQVFTQRLP